LLSSLLPELARSSTRQSCDANARFTLCLRFLLNCHVKCSAAFKRAFRPLLLKKEKEKEKARLATTLMRYMTLESSKLFKLALTWVATTQSDAIE
jgi:hypothetical protein